MQPEELIQQKEWQELTNEEKNAIRPIAGDEQEFNLLKKMLILAAEETNETPAPDPSVQQRLREVLKKPRVISLKWAYAAAAVLIIALSTWFILNKSNRPADIVKSPPASQKDTAVPLASNDSIQKENPPSPEITFNQKIKTKKTKAVPTRVDTIIPSPDNRPNDLLVINTSVRANKDLEKFITEVYE